MGIALNHLERLAGLGIFQDGAAVLDIGCSNLYGATESGLIAFMARFGVEDNDFAGRLAEASAAKTAFAGELLTRCGIRYDAIDIAQDYRTTVFDLNRDRLPWRFRRKFDVVMNFGTTEHVLNQAHAFKVIHDAAKGGAHIFHQVPAAGWTGHGYFLYTTRFFGDLAGYNRYEVVDFWHDQAEPSLLSAPVRDYSTHFPVLSGVSKCPVDAIPNTAISVVYRKVHDSRFVFPLDTSTSYSKPKI